MLNTIIVLWLICLLPICDHRLYHSYRMLDARGIQASNYTFSSLIDRSSHPKATAKHILAHFENTERFLQHGVVQATPHCRDISELFVRLMTPGQSPRYCGLQYITDFSLEFTASRVINAAYRFVEMIQTISSSILSSYQLAWTQSFTAMVSYIKPSGKYRECTLVKTIGYRVRSRGTVAWGVAADGINVSTSDPVFKRQVLSEVVFIID